MISNIHNLELCEDQNSGKSFNQLELEKTEIEDLFMVEVF